MLAAVLTSPHRDDSAARQRPESPERPELLASIYFELTMLNAAASVLERGALYSRERARQLGLLDHDSAHPDIMLMRP